MTCRCRGTTTVLRGGRRRPSVRLDRPPSDFASHPPGCEPRRREARCPVIARASSGIALDDPRPVLSPRAPNGCRASAAASARTGRGTTPRPHSKASVSGRTTTSARSSVGPTRPPREGRGGIDVLASDRRVAGRPVRRPDPNVSREHPRGCCTSDGDIARPARAAACASSAGPSSLCFRSPCSPSWSSCQPARSPASRLLTPPPRRPRSSRARASRPRPRRRRARPTPRPPRPPTPSPARATGRGEGAAQEGQRLRDQGQEQREGQERREGRAGPGQEGRGRCCRDDRRRRDRRADHHQRQGRLPARRQGRPDRHQLAGRRALRRPDRRQRRCRQVLEPRRHRRRRQRRHDHGPVQAARLVRGDLHRDRTGLDTGRVATTTFTDASIGTYDQCSNDDGDGYATGDPRDCGWTTAT